MNYQSKILKYKNVYNSLKIINNGKNLQDNVLTFEFNDSIIHFNIKVNYTKSIILYADMVWKAATYMQAYLLKT